MAVDASIKAILEKGSSRARSLPPSESAGRHADADPYKGVHVMYTRVLSCILFPHTLAAPDEVEAWKADNYKLLRGWVANCREQAAVSPPQHAAALEFLESADGKGSLMAGFLARLAHINRHPFYEPAAFSTPLAFEQWKMRELESVEHQRTALEHFSKTELLVNVYSVRAVEEVGVDTLGQAVGDPVGAVKAANSKIVGMGKLMMEKSAKTSKTYRALFSRSPVSAALQGTKGLISTSVDVTKMTLMSPAAVTQTLSRKRADLWCTISFAGHQHTSPVVGDVTPGEELVRLETDAKWQVRPGERSALCVHLYRKRNFAVEIKEAEVEMLGSVMWCWDELWESGQRGQAHEGWVRCDEGYFDCDGRPAPGTREVSVRVELLTKPIDGSEARALFDPADDLHAVYTELYRGLASGVALMPPPSVDWLLHEMRIKCGISHRWHTLLRLAPGLNLHVGDAGAKDEAVQVREGRLIALLGCIRELDDDKFDASAHAVPFALAVGVRQALRFLQAQVRNGLLMFPYKLAVGPEGDEEYQEPTELRLLCQLDDAIQEQLAAQEARDPKLSTYHMGVHPSAHLPTDQVLAEGLRRFVRLFCAHHLSQALRKDACSGKTARKEEAGPHHWAAAWSLPQGEVMGKHVKKVVKRSIVMIDRLHQNFSQVLPAAVLRGGVEDLLAIVTVDVLSLISAYHLRGQAFDAFQEVECK